MPSNLELIARLTVPQMAQLLEQADQGASRSAMKHLLFNWIGASTSELLDSAIRWSREHPEGPAILQARTQLASDDTADLKKSDPTRRDVRACDRPWLFSRDADGSCYLVRTHPPRVITKLVPAGDSVRPEEVTVDGLAIGRIWYIDALKSPVALAGLKVRILKRWSKYAAAGYKMSPDAKQDEGDADDPG